MCHLTWSVCLSRILGSVFGKLRNCSACVESEQTHLSRAKASEGVCALYLCKWRVRVYSAAQPARCFIAQTNTAKVVKFSSPARLETQPALHQRATLSKSVSAPKSRFRKNPQNRKINFLNQIRENLVQNQHNSTVFYSQNINFQAIFIFYQRQS
jgi:hypothetical protein